MRFRSLALAVALAAASPAAARLTTITWYGHVADGGIFRDPNSSNFEDLARLAFTARFTVDDRAPGATIAGGTEPGEYIYSSITGADGRGTRSPVTVDLAIGEALRFTSAVEDSGNPLAYRDGNASALHSISSPGDQIASGIDESWVSADFLRTRSATLQFVLYAGRNFVSTGDFRDPAEAAIEPAEPIMALFYFSDHRVSEFGETLKSST